MIRHDDVGMKLIKRSISVFVKKLDEQVCVCADTEYVTAVWGDRSSEEGPKFLRGQHETECKRRPSDGGSSVGHARVKPGLKPLIFPLLYRRAKARRFYRAPCAGAMLCFFL